MGCGAGYDAYEFCRRGAEYTGLDITPENIERSKKHLAFYGYLPVIVQGDTESLPFEGDGFNVVFSSGVLHHTPDIEKSFQEAFRVLKRGGEFWVIMYHKNSIFYWVSLFLVEHILRRGFLKQTFRERLSMIEHTTSSELPLVNAYSRRALKKMLRNANFRVELTRVRKLVADDLPALSFMWELWPLIPQSLLDFIGKRFGWYIIAKSKKV